MMHFGARERARSQGYCVQKVGVLPVLRLGSKLSKAVIKLHALHDDQSLTRSLHRLESKLADSESYIPAHVRAPDPRVTVQ